MFVSEETAQSLVTLGARLRAARLAKGDGQERFARRLGVSVVTLRALERGEPTVSIGLLASALWALSRAADLDQILAPKENLFEQMERKSKSRQRASRQSVRT